MTKPKLHPEDAYRFLLENLANTPLPGPGEASARRSRANGADIWIDLVCNAYWHSLGVNVEHAESDEKESYAAAFYDAAWDLSRRGVLRPGAAMPAGQTSVNQMGQRINAAPFFGDGYSLTAWGRDWVRKAVDERGAIPSDPGRLAEVLAQFERLFGSGYAQRANEATASWRSGNYLSACVMAGAAAESILLSTAIKRSGDERKVMADYRTASGRRAVTKLIVAHVSAAVAERLTNALGILSYWRDDASHGTASTIGEVEAHEAITRLLRLAQFVSDSWAVLTGGEPVPEYRAIAE